MADFAYNYTSITKLYYTSCMEEHSFILRWGQAEVPAEIMAQLASVKTAVANAAGAVGFADFAFTRATWQRYNQDISTPFDLPADTEPVLQSTIGPEHEKTAEYYTFGARSTAGSRFDFQVFGLRLPGTIGAGRYKMNQGVNPAIDAVRAAVRAANKLTAVDGNFLTWYPYCTNGVSAYWQRELRP